MHDAVFLRMLVCSFSTARRVCGAGPVYVSTGRLSVRLSQLQTLAARHAAGRYASAEIAMGVR